jgi:hypothetical protein
MAHCLTFTNLKKAVSFHKTAYEERKMRNDYGLEGNCWHTLGPFISDIVAPKPVLQRLRAAAMKGANAIERIEKSESSKVPTTPLTKRVRVASEKAWLRDISVKHSSQTRAKLLAKQLFVGLTFPAMKDYAHLEYFKPYFDSMEETKKAFEFFDQDGTGDVSRSDMKQTLVTIYREKKVLAKTLRDLSEVVGTVDKLLLLVTLCCTFVSWALIFDGQVINLFISVGSLFLALSFSFGQSVREVFESLIFLFVTHPYDTGILIMQTTNASPP